MDSFNHYAQQFIRFVNFDLHYDPLDECCFDNKVAGIWNMYGVLITLFCADTMTAVDELEASKGNRKYWLHSLLTVVFKGFAGGCLAPMFIGKAPMIIADDIALLSCIVTWYVVHNTALVKLLVQEPIRVAWTTLSMIFRGYVVCTFTKMASEVIHPGRPIYPIPLIGPLIVGTTVIAAGCFIPLDTGLECIRKSTPIVMQGGFVSSFMYHFMVNDVNGGFIGNIIKYIIGSYSEHQVRAVIALLWILTGLGQLFYGAEFNVFYSEIINFVRRTICMPDVCRALCPLLKNVTGTGCVCFYLDTDDKNCTCNSEVSKVKYGEMNLFQSAYHHGYWLCIYYVRYVLFTTAMIYCYDMFKN